MSQILSVVVISLIGEMIFGGNDTSKLHVNFSGEMIFGGNDRQPNLCHHVFQLAI